MNQNNVCTFIFFVIILSKRSSGADYRYEACVPRSCGRVNISFPFYIPGLQESYCGFSRKFMLTCSSLGFPILQLPENDYVVEHISYETQTFRVYDAAVLSSNGSNCIPRISNTTLPTPQFNYIDATSLHLFSNCSKQLSQDLLRYKVVCDGEGSDSNLGLALYDDNKDLRIALEECEGHVVAPVAERDGDDGNNGIENVVEVLREGFDLNWTASDCNACETSGGHCGFNETTYLFQCFCPDRPHSRSCKPVYYRRPEDGNLMEESNNIPRGCDVIQMPMNSSNEDSNDLFKLLTPEFSIEWNVSPNCLHCHSEGGQCVANSENEFVCRKGKSKTKVILATAIPGGAFIVCVLVCLIIWQRRKRIKDAYLLSRNMSSNPSSKSDIEGGSFYFGIPVFSYAELVEATNNFDSSRELGDGGFGTVYYGKLKDGREVAIKRLYEHNYKRVEQFMNEVKILTCLRHPNLVSLYGCTSRRSRELLLVYEYVRNGTVADHLHGERAKEAPLTWAFRMSIAIETANALSYLHKSDIIHRDVKTNNILLDENYCVKVADFGLSRLFPNDVSHISTAPQGTPGYVDPEYHQCYQLTDKSDVYSFGVVLIELISSMPAVDISRHRHEINLANLALNKIQRCAFDELIDSSLGYDTDIEVTRMTTSVAELAFRCLQLEKEMRPSMDEVFDFLKDIQSGDELTFEKVKEGNGKIPPSPETDDIVLLKNKNFQSPIAVTDKWVSGSSTTTSSIE